MIRDFIGFAGIACVVAGLWMYSHPLAVVVAGVSLVACAIFVPERKKRTRQAD